MKVRQLTIMKKQIIIWSLVLLATALLIRASREWVYEPVKVEAKDTLSPLIDKLAMCESGGNPEALNADDGGSPSYGLLQWKADSLWRYNIKYRIIPDIEREEIMNVIMDSDVQIAMAEKVLEEPNGWRNWYNCLKTTYE